MQRMLRLFVLIIILCFIAWLAWFKQPIEYNQAFLAISDMHLNASDAADIHYGEDTGINLWESTKNELNHLITEQKPRFVVLTGDLPKHNDRTNLPTNIATVLKSLADLEAIHDNNLPVFYAFGNNDSLTQNYGSYFDGTHNLFYLDPEHGSPAIKGWPTLNANPDCSVSPDFACTYTTTKPMPQEHAMDMAHAVQGDGYYSAYPLGSHVPLRLISLNTVLFSRKSAINGSTQLKAIQNEMDWLEAQLASASKNNESVYIIMHIPVGKDAFYSGRDMWNTTLTLKNGKSIHDAFLALMIQYQNIIRVLISGHTHKDELRALYSQNSMDMEVLGVGVPGITPNHFNNPGMQIFSYDPTFQLTEAKTFYTTPVPGEWKMYSFREDYQCAKNSTLFSCVKNNILPKLSAWKLEAKQLPSNPYEINYSVRNSEYIPIIITSWYDILSAIQVKPDKLQ